MRSGPYWRWAGVCVVGVAVGWCIAAFVEAPTPRGGASSAPVPQATTTRSAPRSSTGPTDRLRRLAEERAEQLQGRLDGAFSILLRPPFVIAGDLPAAELRSCAERAVLRPARAMWGSLFDRRPDRVVTVLLLADNRSYRRWAERLFGDRDIPYFGYYRRGARTLVMDIHTGTGTLVHELTHALMAFDWPEAPLWLNEGLASLHEQCRVVDGAVVGLPNWRLTGLQNEIRAGRLRPLAALVAADDFYGPLEGVNYAQARYFCLYLQSRGLLWTFYRRCRDADARGESAAAMIEQVCGRPIAEVDRAMRRYVMTLRWE